MNKKYYSYLIVGNGRIAKHLTFFFQSQNIRISSWNRTEHTETQLQELHLSCDFTLLCISDSALKNFILNHNLKKDVCVHFSGSLSLPETLQFHPLMTFNKSTYPISTYPQIPFIGVKGQPHLSQIFPFLNNPYYEINKTDKAHYHALCVLAGNFTNLLWNKAFSEFEKMSLPKEVLYPFMKQVFENLKERESLTGPLARRDTATLQKNLDSLEGDNFFDVYKSFIKAHDPQLIEEMKL